MKRNYRELFLSSTLSTGCMSELVATLCTGVTFRPLDKLLLRLGYEYYDAGLDDILEV
jgi:opacity protein-like surface antigen